MLEAPVFQVVVVGSGGGPDETNLSAYLLKLYNANWEDGVIGLEAGSGQGALARLLRKNPSMLDKKLYSASEIYSFVRCFLITHAHLDHINSLIISAGSLEGPRKRVYGIKRTLEDLELIFADRIWPNLASWKEEDESIKLLYSILTPDGKYNTIYPAISVRTMPLNHGTNALGQYNSAAYFIRHDPSHREFLFFGDVEPDSLTVEPLTINVWRVAAPKIPAILSTIFIECSWPSGRPDELLFGHLTPEHLADELSALATEVIRSRQANTQKRPLRKRQKRNSISPDDLKDALVGLTVYVMHCKDDMHVTSGEPTRDLIVEQVRCIIEERQLGAKILAAEQGACITI